MNLVRALGSVGGLTLASRILALGRDTLQATFVGAGFASDAFLVAFRLPNMFRAFFAEGAFNAAFTPLFNKKVGAEGDYPAAYAFAERALALLLPILIVFTLAMLVAAEPVTWALSGGFDDPTPDQFAFAVTLSRITIPYLALMSVVSLLGGILTSLERFWVNAAAPVLLNIAMIVALVFFHGDNPYETARAQAVAVTAGGVLQLGWLVIACRQAGVRLRLRLPRIDADMRALGRLVLPAALGAGATQINLLVSTALAGGLLDAGSISYIYYADRLNQLPLGMIGIGLGTILLPTLSRLLAAKDDAGAMTTQNRGIELALFLTLPATVAFLAAAEPIVRGLFQHGAFTLEDARKCAWALAAFSIGLPAYVLIKVLAPAFYARGDTKTPARFALVAVGVNLLANLALIPTIGHVGPPLATALAALVNIAMLAAVLVKRGHLAPDARLRRRLPRLALSALAMGAALWFLAPLAEPWLAGPLLPRTAALAALVAGGGLVYALACIATRAYGPADLRALRRPSPSKD